jgi:transposase
VVGAARVDDRRVISGILHMLRVGARWRDCPAAYGPYTTIYNRFNRWSRQGIWHDIFAAATGESHITDPMAIDRTHVKAHRSAGGEKGAFWQADARAAGATPRSTRCGCQRPTQVLLLSPGNIADISMAPALLARAGPLTQLIADRAYDANSLRSTLREHGAEAVIPSTRSRKRPIRYDPKQRNLIEHVRPPQGLPPHRHAIRQARPELLGSRNLGPPPPLGIN